MPIFRDRSAPEIDADVATALAPDASYDVLALRHLSQHPDVQPLIERRTGLRARLTELEQLRAQLVADLAALERQAASEIAADGDAWQPSALRQAKHDLADIEEQQGLINTGLAMLDDQIDAAAAQARLDVEARLNAKRAPLVAQRVRGLAALVEANRQLHAIEGLSTRLLKVGHYHLIDGGLEQRLRILRRSLAMLDPDLEE
jgi:hypothetical protein